MTTQLDITAPEAAALADLAIRAPSTMRTSVLVEVGLMDRYGRIEGSPLGPLVVAWNGVGVVSVDLAATMRRSRLGTSWRPAVGQHRPTYRPVSRTRSAGASTATGGRPSGSTCAAIPGSNRMSGARR